jgi:hypothetical protein
MRTLSLLSASGLNAPIKVVRATTQPVPGAVYQAAMQGDMHVGVRASATQVAGDDCDAVQHFLLRCGSRWVTSPQLAANASVLLPRGQPPGSVSIYVRASESVANAYGL